METIWYKGIAYPARTIVIDGNELLVSIEELWDELLINIRNGSFEAAEVDDKIFYYCRDKQELNDLTDEEIYNLTC